MAKVAVSEEKLVADLGSSKGYVVRNAAGLFISDTLTGLSSVESTWQLVVGCCEAELNEGEPAIEVSPKDDLVLLHELSMLFWVNEFFDPDATREQAQLAAIRVRLNKVAVLENLENGYADLMFPKLFDALNSSFGSGSIKSEDFEYKITEAVFHPTDLPVDSPIFTL